MLLNWFDTHPRRVFGAIALFCSGLLIYGLYLQHIVGLNPCPMCIVQRYALFFVAIVSFIAWSFSNKAARITATALVLLGAGFGAFVAARQSWLQWYPPETVSCGRDFYGMIETFPLQRAIPMIFKGSGDCTAIDWTFLGGSIANWSFICFVCIAVLSLILFFRQLRSGR
jgi:protein dithiol:quinone oxidoreductase